MKKFPSVLFLVLFAAFVFVPAKAQSHLQKYVDELKFGTSNLRDLKLNFGEPDSTRKSASWFRDPDESDLSDKQLYLLASPERKKSFSKEKMRTIHGFNYKRHGLVFYFFDNPWELYSVEITNPEILILGIKVGDDLSKVKKMLGESDMWLSSNARNDWSLEYEKLGVDFIFARDERFAKYPMKLAKPKKVIRIERLNKNVSFGG